MWLKSSHLWDRSATRGCLGFFLKGQQDNNRGSSLMHPLEVSGIKKKTYWGNNAIHCSRIPYHKDIWCLAYLGSCEHQMLLMRSARSVLNPDACLSDSQRACHHLDGLAWLSVVTLFSQLFCTLVIAFYIKRRVALKARRTRKQGYEFYQQTQRHMNHLWPRIFADTCSGEIRSYRFVRLLTEQASFLSISRWCAITNRHRLWERNW